MLAKLVLVASVYASSAVAAATGKTSARPDCVSKCWEYTQYVSPSCLGDTTCLCNDSEYQNAVYQCLYSQCNTAQFASALHHTLGICHVTKHAPAEEVEGELASSQKSSPALLRQDTHKQRMRKRQQPYASASHSATYSAVRSAGPSVTRSAGNHGPTAASNPTATRGQQSVSASAYAHHRGTHRAAPTLSVSAPYYRRAR